MKNSDQPAAPIKLNERFEDCCSGNVTTSECDNYFAGLTKREHLAALAMQGLLSNSGGPIQQNPMSGFNFCNCDEDDVAGLSVSLADALLNELEKQ